MMSKLSYDTKIDCILIGCFACFLSLIYLTSQNVSFSYIDLNSSVVSFMSLLAAVLILFMFDNQNGEMCVFHSMALAFVYGFLMIIFCYIGPASPFPPIDSSLRHLDLWMGLDPVELVRWALKHPTFNQLLNFSYQSLIYELTFMFFIVAFTGQKKDLKMFVLNLFLANFMGALIFYFFPTISTATQYSGVPLPPYAYKIVEQYHNIHANLPIQNYFIGIISFPSFHIITAAICLYYGRKSQIIFTILLFWNILIMIATLTTGWHYAIDAIMGFVLTYLSIKLTLFIFSRYPKSLLASLEQRIFTLKIWQQGTIELALFLSILLSTLLSTWNIYALWLCFILCWGPGWKSLVYTHRQ